MTVFPLYLITMHDRPTSFPDPRGVMDIKSDATSETSIFAFVFGFIWIVRMICGRIKSAEVNLK